jgi:cystathionine beta-lyase/cystathionine gamma-synthase
MKRLDPSQHFETLCVRASQGEDDGDSLVTPIVQSTTFRRAGIESPAQHAYSRVSNPTVGALESTLGQLEQAPPAVAFSTGLAAEAALFLTLLRGGDHVICSRAAYGGTTRLLQQLLPGLGIQTSFVDTTDAAAVAAAIRDTTRLIFVETPANPTLDVTDIRAVARVAHAAGATLAVDNTFLTPILQQPLEFGADVSVYSTTKLIEGHSVALGGALISRDEPLLERLRFVRKCTGGIQTPFNAWLTIQGLKTLPLRIQKQSETAQRTAAWLAERAAVSRVCYPRFADRAQAETAERQHRGQHGAVVAFELEGGAEVARRLLGHFRLFRLVEHVGSVDSLVTHPASMTHADVPPEQRELIGVTDGLVRLSIGLEHVDDIIADLDQAIRAALPNKPCDTREVQPCAAIA